MEHLSGSHTRKCQAGAERWDGVSQKSYCNCWGYLGNKTDSYLHKWELQGLDGPACCPSLAKGQENSESQDNWIFQQ